MTQSDRSHFFGSRLTDLKLDIVANYLSAYTTALSKQRFNLWYIDAFAGTGERTVRLSAEDASLLETSKADRIESRRGSARIAIDTKPEFDRLIFIETKRRHLDALNLLRAEYPHRDISVVHGDANEKIQRAARWSGWRSTRAVMFLDPYGMNVDWKTLEAVKETAAIDVWYLVSLSGLYRQATLKGSALDEKKRAAIIRMLGTADWETEWYKEYSQVSLFSESERERHRIADLGRIEAYVTKRLESLFPLVLPPRRLMNDRNAPMFSLYFLMANPSSVAQRVATDIAGHILQAGSSSQVRP